MEEYFAHRTEDGRVQLLCDHLRETAELCRHYAVSPFEELAGFCGVMHDIGKYSENFQKRVRGDDTIKVEHACCAAKAIFDDIGAKGLNPAELLAAYCVAGHHSGLPDGGTKCDLPEEPTLFGKLKRGGIDARTYQKEISVSPPDNEAFQKYLLNNTGGDSTEVLELFAFLTRYIFSCLTDADFIDTERFFSPQVTRNIEGDFSAALENLNRKMVGFACETAVQQARAALQQQAWTSIAEPAQLYLLNMPTGSGKTLCSLKLALERAIAAGKKRIIYVIPYNTIIEQTAAEFEKILPFPVLQHHSNFTFEDLEKKDLELEQENAEGPCFTERLKKATENWDAPLIITTNVQFFESLYHYKSAKLRKMHNLADSILVFDEIHMMPVDYLQPCLRAIGYITTHLNSEAFFLSATMPDFEKLLKRFAPNTAVKDLVAEKSVFSAFANCAFTYLGTCSKERIAMHSAAHTSSLIIVNSRRTAKELYAMCGGKKYHLSTHMMPAHRSRTIDEIRALLKAQKEGIDTEPFTVVSTSLIEAGVDLDFEAVYREISGIDSMIQSAGRCNREGQRTGCYTYVFRLEDENLQREIALRANITESLFGEYENLLDPACIAAYYDRLYGFDEQKIMRNSIANGCRQLNALPFRTYAEQFKLIENETIQVVIPGGEADALLKRLEAGEYKVKRALTRYSACVSRADFTKLREIGALRDTEMGVFVLANPDYYDSETGLDPDKQLNYMV